MLDKLRAGVCEANKLLERSKLLTLTFGNVSGIDPETRLVAIKPSGIPYCDLPPDEVVTLDLDGTAVEGTLRPSSATPTHLVLYRAFPTLRGIAHTHSTYATMFAQARVEIPCFGTTHADYFNGTIPVTRLMTPAETASEYETNTGHVIVERFQSIKAQEMPAVLVACHGPFAWGKDADDSVQNSIVLEQVAATAYGTIHLNQEIGPISQSLLNKHFSRKHGPKAYYGQK